VHTTENLTIQNKGSLLTLVEMFNVQQSCGACKILKTHFFAGLHPQKTLFCLVNYTLTRCTKI